ncbi:MAG: hypothetical protein IJ899_03030 [Blautia sp.]|nr:hypothetical protein [Blautia sp.]
MKKKISYEAYQEMFPERVKIEDQVTHLLEKDLRNRWDSIWWPGTTNEELRTIIRMAEDLRDYMDSIREKSQEAFDEDEEGDAIVVIDVKE